MGHPAFPIQLLIGSGHAGKQHPRGDRGNSVSSYIEPVQAQRFRQFLKGFIFPPELKGNSLLLRNGSVSVSGGTGTVLPVDTLLPVGELTFEGFDCRSVEQAVDAHFDNGRMVFSTAINLSSVDVAQIKPSTCGTSRILVVLLKCDRDPLTFGDLLHLNGVDNRVSDLAGRSLYRLF